MTPHPSFAEQLIRFEQLLGEGTAFNPMVIYGGRDNHTHRGVEYSSLWNLSDSSFINATLFGQ